MKKLAFILFLLCIVFIVSSQASSIWLKGWTYRKTLKIEGNQDNVPVQKIAVLEFTGKAQKDGSDIRIINTKGNEIPYWLIDAGPGNYYQLCFPVNEKTYYLFYGNPSAKKITYHFVPHRGLFLAVYERNGNPNNTWESAKKIIKQSIMSKCFGKSVWEKVWDANNPFGPDENFVKVYKGYFYIYKNIDMSFGTSSGGSSFILIDNKLVASWPGWHGAQPFIKPSHAGSIDLKPGLHCFVYYQIAYPWHTIAVAAIKMPNQKMFKVLPGNFFLPLEKVVVLKTEKKNSPFSVEFSWKNTFYLLRETFPLITFKFTPEIYGNIHAIKGYNWNFGDGQTSIDMSPSHIYINSGIYPVTLSIKTAKGKIYSNTLLVNIEQNYAELYIPSESSKNYVSALEKYNFKNLSNANLFILAGIFESYSNLSDAFACYKILLTRRLNDSEKQKASILAASLAIKTKNFSQAEKIYKSILQKTHLPYIEIKLGKLYLIEDKLQSAEKIFTHVLDTKNIPEGIKTSAEIGLGDIYRERGEKTKADQEYEKVSKITWDYEKTGIYSQETLYYIKAHDFTMAFNTLNLWAEKMPLAKMEGLWSILFARTCFDAKEYNKGLRELNTFTKISSAHNQYMVWVLFIKAGIYEKIGDKNKAKRYYEQVIDLFPGSSLSFIAEKILTEN